MVTLRAGTNSLLPPLIQDLAVPCGTPGSGCSSHHGHSHVHGSQASCHPEAVNLFGTASAAETAFLKCTWALVLQLLSGMCPYQGLSQTTFIWFHICFHVCLCIPASSPVQCLDLPTAPRYLRASQFYRVSFDFSRPFSLENSYLLLFLP